MKVVTGIPILLVVSVASICLFMIGLFRFQNHRLQQVFLNRTQRINEMITQHSHQIQYREKGLNAYDFLLRNLKEALRIQKDIEL
ncbi:hypothetical protein POV27_03670 [Aureisphaera galaxeae]|uniref:hypothetical protein n=1 Tax=Aureisphaera galaxeae TaxID=1538023 RepID=UPI002350E7D8|nr:hypothetical protein [Aureisphaera galaxeae]MDC8003133.1 hypothetical protein [Aureisphaera galaxeae]